jgi:hypothetical protein
MVHHTLKRRICTVRGTMMARQTQRRSSSVRRRSPRKRRRRHLWLTKTKALLATLSTGLILFLITYTVNYDQQIERRTAKAFIEQYYSRVVNAKTRDLAWNMLTPDFQRNGPAKNQRVYEREWRRVRAVRVDAVHHVDGQKNHFLTKVTYILRDGRVSQPEKLSFQLVCNSWVRKQAFRKCAPKDLLLHDATRPDVLARLL